jgi:hypothetical protein
MSPPHLVTSPATHCSDDDTQQSAPVQSPTVLSQELWLPATHRAADVRQHRAPVHCSVLLLQDALVPSTHGGPASVAPASLPSQLQAPSAPA